MIYYSYLKASAGEIREAFHAGKILANKVRKIETKITIITSFILIFDGNLDKK